MTADLIEQSYLRAERITAEWARSFHFASRFLPPPKRRAVFAIYDYCRYADNLVDHRGERPVEAVRADLAALGELVRRLHRGARPDDPRWYALWDALRRYPVPAGPLLDLLEGVAMDLEPVAMPDFATLHRYCVRVAGGVGLMLGPVLGASSDEFDELGVGLGVAMQLTNILRDVEEDLGNDRVYLPADELRQAGLSRHHLERRVMTPVLRDFIAGQVHRARQYFAAADPVVPLFPDDGSRLTVRLLQRTYAGILGVLERRDFDLFGSRAYVPLSQKLVILGRAVLSERVRA